MDEPFRILVADRNRHVRELLRRELTREGYRVEVARDGREVLMEINGDQPPHLLILDLEIPYVDELEVLARLKERQPPLPVVLHTFLPESAGPPDVPQVDALLEKKGDTDLLKSVVAQVIGKYYPHRSEATQGKGG